MINIAEDPPPLRIASVADDGREEEDGEEPTETGATLDLARRDAHLAALCEQLAWWIQTRRFFGSPRAPVSLLGKLGKRTRPLLPGGPDAECSAELNALYIALIAQPADALDRVVFELHYLHRVANVKAASAAVGIGRQHWYTLLREFRRRIFIASREILELEGRHATAIMQRGAAGQHCESGPFSED